MVVDLRGVTYLDSSGLRTLAETDARFRSEGVDVSFIPPPEPIDRIIHVTGFDKLIRLVAPASDG